MDPRRTLKIFSLLAVVGVVGCREEQKTPVPLAPKVEGNKIIFPDSVPQQPSITEQTKKPRKLNNTHLTRRLYWNVNVTVRVFTPVAGRVSAILADLGRSVATGTPLVEIDSPDFGQALADARTAEGNLRA